MPLSDRLSVKQDVPVTKGNISILVLQAHFDKGWVSDNYILTGSLGRHTCHVVTSL